MTVRSTAVPKRGHAPDKATTSEQGKEFPNSPHEILLSDTLAVVCWKNDICDRIEFIPRRKDTYINAFYYSTQIQ